MAASSTLADILDLDIEQFVATQMIADEHWLGAQKPKVIVEQSLRNLAHALTMHLKMPAKRFQSNEEVARWPDGLWNALLHAVGLKRWTKYKVLRVTEMLLFPDVPIPKGAHRVHLHYRTGLTVEDVRE